MRDSVRLAGQCLMIGFDGYAPSAEVRQLVREHAVGGIVLFARNVAEPEQLAALVSDLQQLARAADHAMPLLVAIDQEGGRVARLRGAWTEWPPLRALGAIGSEDLVERLGSALAEQLVPCGIYLDFAPVVDVDTNPKNPVIGDRAFSDDADLVARLGAALVRGLQQAGVAACAKHFPGHGDTEIDSHVGLPAVDHERARLDDVELRPFRAALAAGVAAVMTAHVVVRALDASWPATLSPRVMRDILRKEMAFGGAIVSDDLEMKAVAERWHPATAAVQAIKAGCDLLLVCHSADAQAQAHEGLLKAVEAGTITIHELAQAAGRVRHLKERFIPAGVRPDPKAALAAASGHQHRALAAEIARRGGISA